MLADKGKVWISEETIGDVEHATHDCDQGHLARLTGEPEALIEGA